MHFIALHKQNSLEEVYINAFQISVVSPDDKGAIVETVDGGILYVSETPTYIMSAIRGRKK